MQNLTWHANNYQVLSHQISKNWEHLSSSEFQKFYDSKSSVVFYSDTFFRFNPFRGQKYFNNALVLHDE